MIATLFLPGLAPQTVLLPENTCEAAAALLGVSPQTVAPAAEVFPLDAGPVHGWATYHGRFLLLEVA